MTAKPTPTTNPDQVLCLLGATRLADFITFVRERTVGGRARDKGELADLWRQAAKVFEA